jgi:hypothetical protein
MTTKNELFERYTQLSATVDQLVNALEEARKDARACLETIQTEHGNGPHVINGKEVVILRRKGTMCTMPAKRKKS